MADATLHKILEGHTSYVVSVAFSPDSKLLASASGDDTVCLWNIPNGDLNAELKGHEHKVSSVAFSPDGKSIVTGSEDKTVRTWSVAAKKQVQKLTGHSKEVVSVAWSPNGDVIASGSTDKTVILWDAISGSAKKKLTDHTSWVSSVLFSQDGNKLASAAAYDKTVIIWDVNSGAALIKLAHFYSVWSVCFSPDDQFVVTGGGENVVRMFNANNGREEKRFEGHTRAITSVACSFDGSMIMSGSEDKSVRLWDMASTKQLQQLDGHTRTVWSVAFSRDGKLIASGSDDKTVCLWNAPSSLQTPTSLLKACFTGDFDSAKFQLDDGALVNNKGPDGKTALHQAIIGNHTSIVQLLLQRGADINIADDSNRSALQLASQSKSVEIKATFHQATSLQNKNLKSVPASELNQTAQFTLRLGNNKFGLDIWDTLTSSSACKQFLVGLFLQSNPSLGTIPDSVAKLDKLLCLSVADCGLASSDIRNLSLLTSLHALDLSNNPLIDIPNEFANLKQLRRVSVSNCKLSAIPAFVFRLPHSIFVDASKNKINRVPVAIASMPSLTDLVLSGNPLSSIPSEYHNKPTEQLFTYLRDLATESKPVYRSKLLLVGYGGVGKTTFLNGMFPPEGVLEIKSRNLVDTFNPWQKRFCEITGSNLVYYRSTGEAIVIELLHSTVTEINDFEWKVKPQNEAIQHEFRCSSALEREEWVRICRFHAKNYPTDGISVVYRDIPSDHLNHALLACALQNQTNRVPNNASLQLSVWDFAGQHEYQDGHQLFLTSRAIYLVLWDVRPKKRQTSLAQLRHWLSTLQLHLGSSDDNIRSSALVYVVGSFGDGGGVNLEQCRKDAQQAVDSVHLTVAYRIIPGLCLRKQADIDGLKVQLLADLATQQHLGEEVPTTYLDLEHRLRQEQDRYRLSQLQNNKSNVVPVLKRSDLVLQLKQETGLVTRALKLLHMWGSIVYLGGKHARLNELVVAAPEWLTVGVLGSLVRLMRVEISKQIDAKVNVAPIVRHKDLLDYFDVWRSLQGDQQEEVLQTLYAFDLGFAASMTDHREFGERSSFFPQLLPVKPPSTFEWMPNTSTPEVSRVIELNGIPMGFNTVLLSRLRSCLPDVYLPSCWHSGFLFKHIEDDNNQNVNDDVDKWRVLLVTVHEDSSRIRFCVRNSSDFNRVFEQVIGVFRQLLLDRYLGVTILNEFVECVCDGCQASKWRWNKTIANDVFADKTITRLMADTASRAELSQAILSHAQPNDGPHNFLLSTIKREIANGRTTITCRKTHQAVTISSQDWSFFETQISMTQPSFSSRVALVVGNDKYSRCPLNHAVKIEEQRDILTQKRTFLLHRFGLVIGNSYFHDVELSTVPNDIGLVVDCLKNVDIPTSVLSNGTLDEISEAINNWANSFTISPEEQQTRSTDRYQPATQTRVTELKNNRMLDKSNFQIDEADALFFLYFTGHGEQHNGTLYIVPEDSPTDYSKWYSVQTLLEQLSIAFETVPQMKASVVIMIDACRANKQSKELFTSVSNITVTGFELHLIFSAQSSQFASAGTQSDRYGPFAEGLSQALKKGVSLDDAVREITKFVASKTTNRQHPIVVRLAENKVVF